MCRIRLLENVQSLEPCCEFRLEAKEEGLPFRVHIHVSARPRVTTPVHERGQQTFSGMRSKRAVAICNLSNGTRSDVHDVDGDWQFARRENFQDVGPLVKSSSNIITNQCRSFKMAQLAFQAERDSLT